MTPWGFQPSQYTAGHHDGVRVQAMKSNEIQSHCGEVENRPSPHPLNRRQFLARSASTAALASLITTRELTSVAAGKDRAETGVWAIQLKPDKAVLRAGSLTREISLGKKTVQTTNLRVGSTELVSIPAREFTVVWH